MMELPPRSCLAESAADCAGRPRGCCGEARVGTRGFEGIAALEGRGASEIETAASKHRVAPRKLTSADRLSHSTTRVSNRPSGVDCGAGTADTV